MPDPYVRMRRSPRECSSCHTSPVLRGEALRVDGRLPTPFWVGVGLKAGLVALLLLPLVFPDLEQYDGKGMSWRILVFPLAGVVVPLLWYATGQRRPYPYLADNLLVLPAITDVLWNTLDAYDRVWWWDDVNHLVNSMVLARCSVQHSRSSPSVRRRRRRERTSPRPCSWVAESYAATVANCGMTPLP